MNENIDVPFLWLWSCKGSSNCLYLDQAVLRVRCLPWLRSDSWSTKKNGRHHVIGSPSRPRAPKISRMTSLAAHAPFIGWACAVHGARILLLLLLYNTAMYFVSSDVCRAAVRIWLFILKSPGATGALWLDRKIGCMIIYLFGQLASDTI